MMKFIDFRYIWLTCQVNVIDDNSREPHCGWVRIRLDRFKSQYHCHHELAIISSIRIS